MTTDELKELHLEAVKEWQAEELARNIPGSYGCHEALHVASLLAGHVDEELLSHPAIVSNKEWFRLAAEAHEKLFDLYQAIGNVHLEAPFPEPAA